MEQLTAIPQKIAEQGRAVATWLADHRIASTLSSAAFLETIGLIRGIPLEVPLEGAVSITSIGPLGMALASLNMLDSVAGNRSRFERIITTAEAAASAAGSIIVQTGIPELTLPGFVISSAGTISAVAHMWVNLERPPSITPQPTS